MVPGVTYNGVESEEGGTIFKDCKFWIAQRVPQRSRWIDLVRQNSGTIVQLEKHADMLIADRARRDTPHGSYSWEFIQDSINNGYIQLKDRYLIGAPPEAPRPVGSGQASKPTRTKFTAQDDARIVKWALQHPTDQKGNKIWKDYEKINPRHPAQSWRDRFVKKLMILDRDVLEKMAAKAEEEVRPSATTTSHVENSRPAAERRAENVVAQQSARRRTTNARNISPLDTARHQEQTTSIPRTGREEFQTQPPLLTEPEEDDEDEERKQHFYQDLDLFILDSGLDIKRHNIIKGRTFELWDLAQATALLSSESQALDWYKVAESLGFVDPDDDTVNELFLCYDQYLRGFLETMMQIYQEDGEVQKPEEIAYDMDPDQGPNFEGDQDNSLPQSYVRSSPPVNMRGTKRSAGQRPLSSSGQWTKRARYHKDSVIPSTPESKLTPELPHEQEPSPSARKSSQWPDYLGESEASQHLPPLPKQYESQDLGTRATRKQGTRHELVDFDPLPNDEVLDSTPIPLRLSQARLERLPSASSQELRSKTSRRRHGASLEERTVTERAISSKKPNTAATTQLAIRRSLPASFNSSRNPVPRASRPQNSDNSNSREIQECTSRYEAMGYPRHIVVEALKSTTLTPGNLALIVMQHLQEGRGIPTRYEGIWTDRDDADLDFISSVDFDQSPTTESEERQQDRAQKAHNRLVKKHGFQRFNLRKSFIDAQTTEASNT
ncbi:hypothetical protein FHETE_5260 [Fusarium heterosporum]|uniref:DNA-binding protein RAP1 n=1 Tax=Fusarium heterosporum TaxID=42747 RepID=A0A8H5WSK9_FUSHE|nr:hypothetical protein FHETE_5260 [Fusarium heterosporum]